MAATLPGRRRQRGRAVPVDARRGRGDRQDRRLPARRERPHRQGLQRPRGRRGRDDPLQPGRGHRPRVRQPLAAGDPRRRSDANCGRDFVTGHTERDGDLGAGHGDAGAGRRDGVFSSRGPLGDWIKPDITAPGVQILAGTTPQPDQTTADNGPPGTSSWRSPAPRCRARTRPASRRWSRRRIRTGRRPRSSRP